MSDPIEPISTLINQLSRLPGVGTRTAQRLAYHIINMGEQQVRELAEAIFYAKKKIRFCAVCGNISVSDLCSICNDKARSDEVICVVKDARDVLAMERTREFSGKYHVLGGTISPMEGIGPDEIRIKELLSRIQAGGIKEIILATNPDVEGEATAVYISRLIKPLGVRVTRIAHGVPVGADLEYTDEVTLSKAMEGRRDM
ncbi:MAG: recombination mediator RecR [Bacillota bacterium]